MVLCGCGVVEDVVADQKYALWLTMRVSRRGYYAFESGCGEPPVVSQAFFREAVGYLVRIRGTLSPLHGITFCGVNFRLLG